MDHSAYDAANRKRYEIAKELDKIDKFLEMYREMFPEVVQKNNPNLKVEVNHTSELVNDDSTEHNENKNVRIQNLSPLQSSRTESRAINTPPAKVVEMVLSILRETGSPMTRGELLKEVLARGAVIVGRDPAKVLGTTLWRSDKVVSAEGGGYWIADRMRLPGT